MRLIDADALKKSITDMELSLTNKRQILEKIDNAPTVPLPDFKEGYKQAIIDGGKKL